MGTLPMLRTILAAGVIGLVSSRSGAAEVTGLHQIELETPAFQENNVMASCDGVGELSLCYTFFPRVDAGGRIKATGTAEATGFVDGVAVSGSFPVEITGSIRGVAGDGVTPSSTVVLSFRARGATLSAGGQDRMIHLTSKLSGPLDHTKSSFLLRGKRKLTIRNVGASSGKTSLSFFNTAPLHTWKLELAIDPPSGSKLTGAALLSGPYMQDASFAIRGSQSRDGTVQLALKPGAGLKGASFKVTRLDLSGTDPDFELRFKWKGMAGVASSAGTSASWTVVPSDFSSEGTLDAPVDITNESPHVGTVGPLEPSVYVIRGLDPSAPTTVVLERSNGLTDAEVPATAGSFVCGYQSDAPNGLFECATQSDAQGEVRFRVIRHDGNAAGGEFRLSWHPNAILDEGTWDHPVDIGASYAGHAAHQSYYRIADLAPGSPYTLYFPDATGNAAFLVTTDFNDGRFDLCAFKRAPSGHCSFIAPPDGKVLILAAVQGDIGGVEYHFSLVNGGVPNEGSRSAPLDVTGALPHGGSTEDLGSYYLVHDLTPGAPYTATIRNIDRGVSFELFGIGWDRTFKEASCHANNGLGETSLECVAVASSAGELVLSVRPLTLENDATYEIDLAPGGIPNEGLISTPVDVTSELPRVGTVYNGGSRYKARQLGSQPVDVTLDLGSDAPCLLLYVTSPSGEYLCSNQTCDSDVPALCRVTPENGELRIDVISNPSNRGSHFTLDVD